MSNFECCKTKSFPNCYFICVNCTKVYHRSCILKDKSKYTFVGGYKLKCCGNQQSIELLIQEKSLLEDTISELSENTTLREHHLLKLKEDHKNFIEEVSIREEELNALIKKQENELKTASQEIEKLRNEIHFFKTKPKTTQEVQTMINTFSEAHTQTDLHNEIDQHHRHTLTQKSLGCSENIRKNILVIAGNHGRDMVRLLSNYIDNFSISSIIKPNATIHEIIRTTISSTKNFTENDFLVLWPDEKSAYLYQHICTKLSHINFVILTTPSRFDCPNMNDIVYQNNLSLYKKAHSLRGSLDGVIEVNNILRRSNYGLGGYYIRRTGKRLIAAYLSNVIKQREDQRTDIMGKCTKNNSTDLDVNPDAVSNIAEELGFPEKDFLYPRLSQVAPKN